jgi:hypothetical protein
MDRQARKLAVHREEGSEGGSELGSNTDSDSDEKVRSSFLLMLILNVYWLLFILVLIVLF